MTNLNDFFNEIANIQAEKVVDIFESSSERFQESLQKMLEGWVAAYCIRLAKCESPIEQLYGLYFLDAYYRRDFSYELALIPQHEFKKEDITIRVDFAIVGTINGRQFTLVVECDGHDFHDKTREQAESDRQRDRLLKSFGLDVIRFAGSEIYRSPRKCIEETIAVIEGIITKIA